MLGMKSKVAIALAVVLACSQVAMAQEKCTMETNVINKCFQDFRDAAKDIFSSEPDDSFGRAQSVGEALNNCIQCGLDAMQDGFNNINSGSDNNSGSDFSE